MLASATKWTDLDRQADGLSQRAQGLKKAALKYVEAIDSVSNEQESFAEALESFCDGVDEESVRIGCPLLRKFVHMFADLKDEQRKLSEQVRAVLVDVVETELVGCLHRDIKEAKKVYVKADAENQSARAKFRLQVHKRVHRENDAQIQLLQAQSKLLVEKTRTDLARKLVKWEHAKQHFFLNSFLQLAQAHSHFFDAGHKVMADMDVFVDDIKHTIARSQAEEVLACARADAAIFRHLEEFQERELRIAEAELTSTTGGAEGGPAGPLQMTNHQVELSTEIGVFMNETYSGRGSKVTILKEGWLMKKASGRIGQWQRRWFVLQSDGSFYHLSNRGGEDRKPVVNLQISTIKTHQTEPRTSSFSLVSPSHTYWLQAENELERREWIDVIQAVISWLLNNPLLVSSPDQQSTPNKPMRPTHSRHNSVADEGGSTAPLDFALFGHELSQMRMSDTGRSEDGAPELAVLARLRQVPGNSTCADCGAAAPEWACLNLGILMCMDCSGAHRHLGVHISKVRSTTLDVQVWEPNVLRMFEALGNEAVNRCFEATLQRTRNAVARNDVFLSFDDPTFSQQGELTSAEVHALLSHTSPSARTTWMHHTEAGSPLAVGDSTPGLHTKPCPTDAVADKREFVKRKYEERAFAEQLPPEEANARMFSEAFAGRLTGVVQALAGGSDLQARCSSGEAWDMLIEATARSCARAGSAPAQTDCGSANLGLLHVACAHHDLAMAEFIMQQCSLPAMALAVSNAQDAHGRTPLHYCMLYEAHDAARLLLKRGVRCDVRDDRGATPLDAAIARGRLADEELFLLLNS